MRSSLLTVLLFLALAGPAAAAPGSLTFDGCLGDDDEHACAVLPGERLIEPDNAVVSPDGRSLYVTSGEGSLVHFARDAAGALTFAGCYEDDADNGCVAVPGNLFGVSTGLTVSADGRSLYLAVSNPDVVAHFVRADDGTLAFDTCVNNDGTRGCTPVPESPLRAPDELVVSPDGTSLYVTARDTHAVLHLSRSSADGRLTWVGCLNPAGDQGCTKIAGVPLAEPAGVAVSPEGDAVYVAAQAGNALVTFDRVAGGGLVYDSCTATNVPGCVAVTGPVLTAPKDVVAAAGGSVYVASPGTDSVAHLARDPQGGSLQLRDCLADISVGCADPPARPLAGAKDLALSADGRSLYVAAAGAGSVVHLVRAADGALSYDGCVANDDGDLCAQVPRAPLADVASVAASPDGRSLYAAAIDHSTLVRFGLEPETLPAPTPEPSATPEPAVVTPEPVVKPDTVAPVVSAVRASRRVVAFALSEAADVTVTIRRRGARRAKTTRLRGVSGRNRVRRRALRRGRYRVTVTAVDAAGNRAVPATARLRVR